MFAPREARALSANYDEIILSIDWQRVLLEARGLHLRRQHSPFDVCGPCVQDVLLRMDP